MLRIARHAFEKHRFLFARNARFAVCARACLYNTFDDLINSSTMNSSTHVSRSRSRKDKNRWQTSFQTIYTVYFIRSIFLSLIRNKHGKNNEQISVRACVFMVKKCSFLLDERRLAFVRPRFSANYVFARWNFETD